MRTFKHLKIMCIVILLLFTSACNTNTVKNDEDNLYIFIKNAERGYYEEKTGQTKVNFSTINLKNGKVEKLAEFDAFFYIAGATVDFKKNTIYFADRHYLAGPEDYRNNDGDQIYSYNYKTKEKKKLTDYLYYGSHYLFHNSRDDLYVLSGTYDEHRIALSKFDLLTNKSTLLEEDIDKTFFASSYNPITEELVTTVVSETMMYAELDKQETEGICNYPTNDLYSYKDGELSYITTTRTGDVQRIVANDDYIIYYLYDDTLYCEELREEVHYDGYLTYNRKTKETTPGILGIDPPKQILDVYYLTKDNRYLICAYRDTTKKFSSDLLIKYDLVENTYEVIANITENFKPGFKRVSVVKK